MFIEIPEGMDMFEYLAENDKLVKKAAEKYKKWIEMFTPGTKYAKVNEEEGIIIYGIIMDPLDGADEDEAEYLKQVYQNSPELRFVKAYSVSCPMGELGDEWPQTIQFIISDEDFANAKKNHWPPKIHTLDKKSIKFIADFIEK